MLLNKAESKKNRSQNDRSPKENKIKCNNEYKLFPFHTNPKDHVEITSLPRDNVH